jgi:spermidine synthase
MNSKNKKLQKGLHFTMDLYGCDPYVLNSPEDLEKIMVAASEAGSMEILNKHFHKFDSQGVTGFLLLSTSHVSVHTWPEYNYAAFDVFSCSNDENTIKVKDYIIKHVSHNESVEKRIKRGYVYYEFLTSPIYKDGDKSQIKINKKIAEIDSGFQNITILDLEKFGKSLVIDGLVQTSEFDHEIYDKALLKKMSENDREILILGGGDGYVAETALKLNPKLKITIVELDYEVVNHAKKFLGQKIFDHPNVTLVVGDALNYLINSRQVGNTLVDGVICDLTDNPIGTKKSERSYRKFYDEVLSGSKLIIKKGGWISAQAGASQVTDKYLNSAGILEEMLQEYFVDIKRKDIMIPSFSEENCFIYGRKK